MRRNLDDRPVTVAVAGTFNIIHDGHKALLRRAFDLGDRILIGITSDRMAAESRERIVPLEIRMGRLRSLASTMGEHELFVIEDIYGPDDMMSCADILVVSEETAENGRKVNERRKSLGLKPLEVSIVPIVKTSDGSKINASDILDGRYGTSGRFDVPDIAVGSANPVKVEAVRNVMTRVYGDVRITAYDVGSGVPDQPFEGQTRQGAHNRATRALGDHDIAVGIEAGVFEFPDGLYDIQHCAVASKDGRMSYGQGSGFRYPDDIAALVRNGSTVGDAVKQLYGDEDIGKKQGAVGMLSKGLLDRLTLTEQSVTAAMIPRIWE